MFDQSKLGQSFPAFTIEVERSKIRELASAIGAPYPIYHNRAAAQAAGYKDVPMFPTSPTIFHFWGNTNAWKQLSEAGINVMRVLHSEEEYTYLAPIYPGDLLSGITTIIEGKTRHIKDGSMDIVTTETRYTNQQGQHVLTARTALVVRE